LLDPATSPDEGRQPRIDPSASTSLCEVSHFFSGGGEAYLVHRQNANPKGLIMDLKGSSEALTQRTEANALQEKQKQQENQEQLAALETFGKALQKAGQI